MQKSYDRIRYKDHTTNFSLQIQKKHVRVNSTKIESDTLTNDDRNQNENP